MNSQTFSGYNFYIKPYFNTSWYSANYKDSNRVIRGAPCIICNDNSGSGDVPSKLLNINTAFYKTSRAFTTWPIY